MNDKWALVRKMPNPSCVKNKTNYKMKSFLLLIAFSCASIATEALETPHIQFVREYIRELAEIEVLRNEAEEELNGKTNNLSVLLRLSMRLHGCKMR